MLNEFYGQFKSGTDIRGVASEGVEGQPVNLTDEVVNNMADGFVLWLSKKVKKSRMSLKSRSDATAGFRDRILWSLPASVSDLREQR